MQSKISKIIYYSSRQLNLLCCLLFFLPVSAIASNHPPNQAIYLTNETQLHYQYAIACYIANKKENSLLSKQAEELNSKEDYLIQHGWLPLKTSAELITNASTEQTDYFAVAYYQVNTNNTATLLIAHRGTCHDRLGNIFADLQIIGRTTPNILFDAKRYVKTLLSNNTDNNTNLKINNFKVTKIIHTGFSLGGFIASACVTFSAFPETYAVTFDAPGHDYLPNSNDKSAHIINYVTAINIVNTCNTHIGEIRKLVSRLSFTAYDDTQQSKLAAGTVIPGSLNWLVIYELALTLLSHNLDILIEDTNSLESLAYQPVNYWPTAKIELVYGPKPDLPELPNLNFDNFGSTLVSVAALFSSGTQAVTASTLWLLTSRLNQQTKQLEGVVNIKYQRTDHLEQN